MDKNDQKRSNMIKNGQKWSKMLKKFKKVKIQLNIEFCN